jgi:hypothetical protein
VDVDVLRGMRLGGLGALCFLLVPVLLFFVLFGLKHVAGPSVGDGGVAGLGFLLFLGTKGALSALVLLVVLASIGAYPSGPFVAAVGTVAGVGFTAVEILSGGWGAESWLSPALALASTGAVWSAALAIRRARAAS